eukprot:gb/GEZN01010996.1/.p1 GENE.gb/GEZN01010996.1/~~gb/GEZN01010996.1/.p1  ORF type:complete len:356 (-),score=47.95 gb/GEZN01010996.1/:128-1165(-)
MQISKSFLIGGSILSVGLLVNQSSLRSSRRAEAEPLRKNKKRRNGFPVYNINDYKNIGGYVGEHAEAVRMSRRVVKQVKKSQDIYEKHLGAFLTRSQMQGWQAVKNASLEAMKAVHRFAFENVAMWEIVICRLKLDTMGKLSWCEAMEGFCFEERMQWLRQVQVKLDSCLVSHKNFRENIIKQFEGQLDEESKERFENFLRAARIAAAAVGTLIGIFSLNNRSDVVTLEAPNHQMSVTVMAGIMGKVADYTKNYFHWWMTGKEKERREIRIAEEYMRHMETDMGEASAHLLQADVRCEQLTMKTRTGQEEPGMRLVRDDLIPALERLIKQELEPLIALCRQYSVA